jgi:hypothetical protein
MGNIIKPRQERRRMQFWSAVHRHRVRASEHQPHRLDLQEEEAQVVIVTQPTAMTPTDFPWTEADAMYLLLVRRADQLRACRSDPAYEEEIDGLWNAIDAYEARRWANAARHPPKAA